MAKVEVEPPKVEAPKAIRDIPTYQPPTQDWRQEFKKGDDSEDELPDTKKLISQLNLNTGATTDAASVFENNEDFLGGDLNDEDVSNMKQSVEEKERQAAAAALVKPPKGKKKPYQPTGSQ